jgi:hypothetical protein
MSVTVTIEQIEGQIDRLAKTIDKIIEDRKDVARERDILTATVEGLERQRAETLAFVLKQLAILDNFLSRGLDGPAGETCAELRLALTKHRDAVTRKTSTTNLTWPTVSGSVQ